jgi:SSS family solute:Na+ symporter/sodium/proline symporter
MRYGPTARTLGTLVMVLAYTTLAAYQFRSGGRLLNLAAGVEPATGAFITAAFCITVIALAGMLSVSYLDVGNGLMMTVGLGLAVVYLVGHAGGTTSALSALRADQLTVFGTLAPQAALGLFLPTMFLLLGEASMYQKLFSARDERSTRRAVAGWILGTMVIEVLIVSIGMFGAIAVPGLSGEGSEAIVIRVAVDVLPTALGLLLLAAAAAIVVSTASSFLLVPATSLVRDVYQRSIAPTASDRQVLLYTRACVVVLGGLALVVGSFFPTFLATALWAYTMYGAGITPALLAALVWPGATRQGGVASIVAGIAVTIAWETVALARGEAGQPAYLFGIQTVYPALAASIGALVGVSAAGSGRRR